METSGGFLDVQRLLVSSLPRPRGAWVWYGLGAFMLVVLSSSWVSSGSPQLQAVVRMLGGLVMFGLVIATFVWITYNVRQQRLEQQRIEAIEELVQLRRWDEAAAMLDQMLSEPTRSIGARFQALVMLAGVLARYHRYDDSIAILNYLLENVEFDPATARGIRLMRAMSMLHEERLFDVDQAINELRRESPDSAGVALLEIYRDVKTGHPAEALEIFAARLPQLRAQLGHRVADAYGLAARAHDLLGQEAEAAAAFEKATLLCPAEELARRYPEFAVIKDKYRAAARPGDPAAAAVAAAAPAALAGPASVSDVASVPLSPPSADQHPDTTAGGATP